MPFCAVHRIKNVKKFQKNASIRILCQSVQVDIIGPSRRYLGPSFFATYIVWFAPPCRSHVVGDLQKTDTLITPDIIQEIIADRPISVLTNRTFIGH
jgi:hypothetical protein